MTCAAYKADCTSGQTFSASRYLDASWAPSNLFDNSDSTLWLVQYANATEWFQVQFSAEKTIQKITFTGTTNYFSLSDNPTRIKLYGSNTGSFSGEEAELLDTGTISWTSFSQVKSFEFENDDPYTYYRAVCTRGGSPSYYYLALGECQMMECNETLGDIADATGLGDNVNAYSLTDSLSDSAGVSDSVDAYNTDEALSQAVGVSDSVAAEAEVFDGISDVAGIGDLADAGFEADGSIAEIAGIGDSSDAFSWTAWLAANRDRSVIRYYCTLTGANDSLSDLSIPISSFQARKRTGESTYLSVVVPGMALADSIADRLNGELVIDMAYLLDGVESLQEEILRVDLEQINPSIGPRNRSITLVGHKTVTYDARAASIQGANYKYENDGLLGFRFPQADPYLNPGDALTVLDTNDVLTVDYITYAISARGAKFMEVREG